MEYRYAERSPAIERVELWNGKEKDGEFGTKDFCSGGVFVTNCQNKVDTHTTSFLTVKFCHNPNLSYQASHHAVVVHKTDNGLGLKWSHRQY
jgi:hypothetical protein